MYRSNSELGLWRLCIEICGNFYKGPDYIQSTIIYVKLQNFINENIDFIPFVSHYVKNNQKRQKLGAITQCNRDIINL